MKFYSQKNPEYKNEKLGNTTLSVGGYGCTTCCLAGILEIHPREIFSRPEFYYSDDPKSNSYGMIKSTEMVAKFFGGWKEAPNDKKVSDPVIIQTEYGGSTHFILEYNGQKFDPLSLNGTPLINYKEISYRNINKGYNMITQEDLDSRDRQIQKMQGIIDTLSAEKQKGFDERDKRIRDMQAIIDTLARDKISLEGIVSKHGETLTAKDDEISELKNKLQLCNTGTGPTLREFLLGLWDKIKGKYTK
jgi:hypothetical protein